MNSRRSEGLIENAREAEPISDLSHNKGSMLAWWWWWWWGRCHTQSCDWLLRSAIRAVSLAVSAAAIEEEQPAGMLFCSQGICGIVT